ncbi:hypothetical protein NQ315_016494 [Exocentrus adspersus]|uniref:Uncharacterized protein n=1 Tax=Exocentrus adspersus TaxID=1586481 RepID=A0AAV8VZS6_9CUCU|nr:hypothetical protein NQ315_016494 [Exocentrus adspersus]
MTSDRALKFTPIIFLYDINDTYPPGDEDYSENAIDRLLQSAQKLNILHYKRTFLDGSLVCRLPGALINNVTISGWLPRRQCRITTLDVSRTISLYSEELKLENFFLDTRLGPRMVEDISGGLVGADSSEELSSGAPLSSLLFIAGSSNPRGSHVEDESAKCPGLEKIKGIHLQLAVVIFDVASLFTKLSVNEALGELHRGLGIVDKDVPNIRGFSKSVHQINFFRLQGPKHQQWEGAAMSNPHHQPW